MVQPPLSWKLISPQCSNPHLHNSNPKIQPIPIQYSTSMPAFSPQPSSSKPIAYPLSNLVKIQKQPIHVCQSPSIKKNRTLLVKILIGIIFPIFSMWLNHRNLTVTAVYAKWVSKIISQYICCHFQHVTFPRHQELMRKSEFTDSIAALCQIFWKDEVDKSKELSPKRGKKIEKSVRGLTKRNK